MNKLVNTYSVFTSASCFKKTSNHQAFLGFFHHSLLRASWGHDLRQSELFVTSVIFVQQRCTSLHCHSRHFADIFLFRIVISMEASSDDWELIGDITDGDVLADRYIPPVAKASLALPPPSIQHHPRTSAAFQVPSELRPSSSSNVVSTPAEPSHTSCRFTVHDLSTFHWNSAGFHRASPYQVTDLHPGVNDRRTRAGYQPQSFRLQSKPPQSLQSSRPVNEMISDLPPPPAILQRNLDQQAPTRAKMAKRRGGSKTQQTQLTRLRHPSDSPIITGKVDALLREFGPLSDVYQALYSNHNLRMHTVTGY